MIRENWRVFVLLVLLVISGMLLFVPGVGLGTESAGPTNLQYGLELSGGTRIRAPLVGVTAEGVEVTSGTQAEIETAVAEALPNVTQSDVQARPSAATPNTDGGTVEVFARIEPSALAAALDEAGISYSEVREGVTEPTRTAAVGVIRQKIDESGLAGGAVQQVTTSTGDHFIVIEVPNRNQSEVRALVARRGVVEVVAQFPDSSGEGTRNETVLTREDIATVGQVQEPTQGIPQPHVPVVLTDEGAQTFARTMQEYGFTGDGVASCHDAPPRYCLNTVLDGEVVYSASMGRGLAQDIRRGDFVTGKNFVMTTTNASEARRLQVDLRAGALPAPLALDAGTDFFLAPALAENFKLYSLVTGIVAVLAVVVMVFIRYGDPQVAAPMIVTALSEVALLLGFASGVGLALDLSHIAGLIAVIGTGVDDLIIIADEVMAEGSVSSGRVFRTRFRKAFWTIGAAAVTTVIAMSPLAILSLGDLRGFAIITILGVFLGVLVTRPAYGDILRYLTTER